MVSKQQNGCFLNYWTHFHRDRSSACMRVSLCSLLLDHAARWFFNNSQIVISKLTTHLMVSTCLSKGDGCVAQLVEWLLPMPEIRSLNPIIGIFYNYRQLC